MVNTFLETARASMWAFILLALVTAGCSKADQPAPRPPIPPAQSSKVTTKSGAKAGRSNAGEQSGKETRPSPTPQKGPQPEGVAVYIAKGGLVVVDGAGKVLRKSPGANPKKAKQQRQPAFDLNPERDRLLYVAEKEQLFLLHGRLLHRVDLSTLARDLPFLIPGTPEETEREATVRNKEHFRALKRGEGLCVVFSEGDPTDGAMEEGQGYKTWPYYVHLEKRTVFVKSCPEEGVKKAEIELEAAMKVRQLKARCGVEIGPRFYAMAQVSGRNGGGCRLILEAPSPSGRYQLIYARRGADDAMQMNYVVYVVDLETESLVPLRKLFPDDWVNEPPSPTLAIEVVVDGYLDLDGVPWRWGSKVDVLHINGIMLDLQKETPTAVKLSEHAVLIR